MKLVEALKIVQSPVPDGTNSLRIFLACGFTPLHLKTFLAAHLRGLMPGHAADISTGLFGDLPGSIERLNASEVDIVAVAVEWADLDPRLGIRQLGGWRHEQMEDILASAESTARRLHHALHAICQHTTAVVSLPSLPLPPAFASNLRQSAPEQMKLQRIVSEFGEAMAASPAIRIVNAQRMAELSPLTARYDIKSDLLSGFPYTLSHASELAELMAGLIANRPPLKGLITDLDDTLWSGIIGEVGVNAVSWNLDGHSQMHGVYQQFLSSLASAGVLIGAASKNHPEIVQQVWERTDLLLPKENVFPLEVHWEPKSQSVRRILSTWNIAADAAAFIDDSAAEVAEVQAAFPDLICRVFPKCDPVKAWALLHELRDLFGKAEISKEDSMRLRSIREAVAWRQETSGSNSPSDEFLRASDARILFDSGLKEDARAFELINKTNQFNLNGQRFTDAEWRKFLQDPAAFMFTVTYEDRYGQLGKIAVMLGTKLGSNVRLRSWVMSCRAFSRRIEHQCIRYLFQEVDAERIDFDFIATERNGPVRDFLNAFCEVPLEGSVTLSKGDFEARVPQLFHQVEVCIHA